ncbi:glycosyltransferase family 4 protein [Desulfobulbus sp. TB]|nr:glycosyltransferase family 4 protein [Desulfobulbus sp. TB]
MKKIIHLIPYDGIGGVETAARSMINHHQNKILFKIKYIFNNHTTDQHRIFLFNPLAFLQTTRHILIDQPDILIISLWRSCIIALLVKLISPKTRLVLFLHSTKDVHCLDRFLSRLTAKVAHQIWADSKATLIHRLPSFPLDKGRIISFVTDYISAPKKMVKKTIFIFWGRIHLQKKLERAFVIFASVHAVHPDSHYIVIGPNGGELDRIQKVVHDLGIADAVSFTGQKDFNEIKQLAEGSSFYLQTSILEGMAMSVVEAMQLGLVPVVTPVGEIGSYCQHKKNSLIITSNTDSVKDILELLNDPQKHEQIRSEAIKTWADKPLYAESVIDACLKIYFENEMEKR